MEDNCSDVDLLQGKFLNISESDAHFELVPEFLDRLRPRVEGFLVVSLVVALDLDTQCGTLDLIVGALWLIVQRETHIRYPGVKV